MALGYADHMSSEDQDVGTGPRFTRQDLPRTPDHMPALPPGAGSTERVEVWQRYSPAYETQAMALMDVLAARDLLGVLVMAGSEDGEALVGETPDGSWECLFALEDPAEAVRIAQARESGHLEELVDQALAATP